jgi:hypothetical protein
MFLDNLGEEWTKLTPFFPKKIDSEEFGGEECLYSKQCLFSQLLNEYKQVPNKVK